MTMIRTFVVGLCTAAACAPSFASVDTSPGPGGIYRLKPGIYVQEGVDCSSAPNAAIRRYDGRGLSDAHTHACRAAILSRRGFRYTVTQSCVDAGVGKAPRVWERQVVTVENALTFTLRTHGAGTRYRYCPTSVLPAGIR